jgi:predicted nucleic acid-binding protein
MRKRMNTLLLDSFVWLEILSGSKRGRGALKIIGEAEELYTSVLNLYEVRYRTEEIAGEGKALEVIKKIEENCKIMDIDKQISLEGGRLKLKNRRMGAVDCLLLATARIKKLRILSGDEHFRGLENVIII